MNAGKNAEPVEVFAGTAVQATMLKSLLENAEIEAFLKDEMVGGLAPWHSSPGGAGAVKVFVSSVDLEKAMKVVENYGASQS
jgi:hypothetical protein